MIRYSIVAKQKVKLLHDYYYVDVKDEDKKDTLENVLYNLLECIRLLGVMLSPIMPECSEKIAKMINCDEKSLDIFKTTSFEANEATPLFARLDTQKELEEIAQELKKEEKKPKIVKLEE